MVYQMIKFINLGVSYEMKWNFKIKPRVTVPRERANGTIGNGVLKII